MEEKFDIFDSLKKTEKPAVPEGFFASFNEKLASKIEDESEVAGINKTQKTTVPAGFFENFSDNLMDKINDQEQSIEPVKTKVFSLKTFGIVAAIAACALLVFNLMPSESDNNLTADTTNEVEDVTLESEDEAIDEAYLAFLDEDEMITFLIENEDIELDDEQDDSEIDLDYYDEDELYYLLDGDIEDYYLEEL